MMSLYLSGLYVLGILEMCLIVRLKAHIMHFKIVNIWSTCGQHVLPKSGLNTHLEKVKNAILQYLLMKI